MHLVQILLPLTDNDGRRFPPEPFGALRRELTERFGGATFYSRSPAEGSWREGAETSRDDILIVEAMCETLDSVWWRERRQRLEQEFRQEAIVVRAQEITLL